MVGREHSQINQTCVLDILRHVPRCTFSRKQMDAIIWAMEELGVQDTPTQATMKTVEEHLHKICGVERIKYKGAHKHLYYLNDVAAIIAQVSF